MFNDPVIPPDVLVRRIAELIPEYLPGMDTGAAEPTDRRLCWNKTLKALLILIGKERHCEVEYELPAIHLADQQLNLHWKRGDGILLAAGTGWGDRAELEQQLQRLQRLKAAEKVFIYTCNRWQQAVLDQIHAALLRYPFHLAGEEYLFVNLLGSESRMQVYSTHIKNSGPLSSYIPNLLQPLPGSPFLWTMH